VKPAEAVDPIPQRLPFAGLLIAAIAGILFANGFTVSPVLPWIVLGCFLPFLACARPSIAALSVTFACFALMHAWEWNACPSRTLAGW
jgi:hypothetical protein